jgi:hypothetical protein
MLTSNGRLLRTLRVRLATLFEVEVEVEVEGVESSLVRSMA